MKAFRAISALFLALLVVVSSTTFLVGMHFCMGKVQRVALLQAADACAKQKALPPCHRHMKPECCDDEVVLHEASDFKSSGYIHLDAPIPTDFEQSLVLVSEIIPSTAASQFQYYNYDPPLRSCDLALEHQVFLI